MDGNTLDSEVAYLTKKYLMGCDISEQVVSQQALDSMAANLNNHCGNSLKARNMDEVIKGLVVWHKILKDEQFREDLDVSALYQGFNVMSVVAMSNLAFTGDSERLQEGYYLLEDVMAEYADVGSKKKLDAVYTGMKEMADRQLGPLFTKFLNIESDLKSFRRQLKSEGINISNKEAVEIITDYISISTDLMDQTGSYNPATFQHLAGYMTVLGSNLRLYDKDMRLSTKVHALQTKTLQAVFMNPVFPVETRIQYFDLYAKTVPGHLKQAFLDHEQDNLYTSVEQAAESGNLDLLDSQWNMFEEFSKRYIPDDDAASLQREKQKFYTR